MNEPGRLAALTQMIAEGDLTSQEDLRSRLKSLGFETTQSSISRDLKKIGALKIAGVYRKPVIGPGQSDRIDRLDGRLVGDHMIVLRTGPGSANRAAFEIDQAAVSGVLGTIAGDDTIFLAVEDQQKGSAALKKIIALFQ